MNYSFKTLLISSFIALGISACAGTGGGSSVKSGYFKINELTAFEGGVVGKTLWSGSNYVLIDKNKTWNGEWGGKKIFGEWGWEDGAYCRTINTGKRDCQMIEMSEKYDEIRITRNRGAGRVFKMRFK